MKWVEVQIKTSTKLQEIVTNILYDFGVNGLAIEDPNDLIDVQNNSSQWDLMDLDLLKYDFETVIIKGYFPEAEDLTDKIALIREVIEKTPENISSTPLGEVRTVVVNDEDWAHTWKKYYKPKHIGKNFVIKPSWEDFQKKPQEMVIELDPGMAFGTGTHETTILSLEALEKYVNKGDTVFDIGCGSGILSIGAIKLGASHVKAIDVDEVAVEVTNENIRLNKVEDKIQVLQGNLLDHVKYEKANIVVANIIAEVIIRLLDNVGDFLTKDGLFIGSGIIEEKLDLVKDKLSEKGFEILDISKMNSWVGLVGKKKYE